MTDEKILLQMSINITLHHVFGWRDFFLGDRGALAFMPAHVIRIALKGGGYIAMGSATRATVHCLECFGVDAIDTWGFTILQFVDGSIILIKGDGQVKLGEHWALGNLSRMVGSTRWWLLNTCLKWGPKTDMFFCIGSNVAIRNFHGHCD